MVEVHEFEGQFVVYCSVHNAVAVAEGSTYNERETNAAALAVRHCNDYDEQLSTPLFVVFV